MATLRDHAIDENYAFFQTIVTSLMADHAGEFALLRDRDLVGIFPTPGAALDEARRFPDDLYSVQKVIDRPLDLGLMSYAADQRITA